jgi:large subunit ribosomal protein L25
MEKVVLHATHRSTIGKQVRALRRAKKLPAVMYGHTMEATPITLDLRDATKILYGLTASSLVTIELDGKENAALVREKQRNFITNSLLHVDFQVVSLTEKLRVKVAIELTGLSPAIKDFNGVVVSNMNSVEVEAFPQDLPERFIVDISGLKKIGESITVRDLKVSDKIEIHADLDDTIVLITAPAAEEEVVVEGAAALEPEIIEKGKKEEEEGDEKK